MANAHRQEASPYPLFRFETPNSPPRRPVPGAALLSPILDVSLAGGFSIAAFVVFYVCFTWQRWAAPSWIFRSLVVLGFAVNYPHFLVSYQLLYLDYRRRLFSNLRFIQVSLLTPIAILFLLGIVFFAHQARLMQALVFLMYGLVGWHYVKQTYGAMIIGGLSHRYFFTPREKFALRLNLYTVWIASWLPPQLKGSIPLDFFGLPRLSLQWPSALGPLFHGLVLLSGIGLATLLFKKFRATRKQIPLTVVVAYIAALLWLLPAFESAIFFAFVPFFHALQYFLFVLTFKKNQALDSPARPVSNLEVWFRMSRYLAMAVALGAIGFHFLPQFLDRHFLWVAKSVNLTSLEGALWILLNLHHYAIDSLLWKGSHAEVQKYLIASSLAA